MATDQSVRVIHQVRDLLARRPRIFALWGLGLLLGLVLAVGLLKVESGETGARLRFGALTDDGMGPGLSFRVPGIEEVEVVRTSEILRVELSDDFTEELGLLTGDENLIRAGLVVQYRIRELGAYLFAVEDPGLLVEQVVKGEIVEAAAGIGVDEVLTAGKAILERRVKEGAQARLDRYGAGLGLVAISLQSVTPPAEAAVAFREVTDARAEAAQLVSEAEGRRDRALRLARGEAEGTEREATSWSLDRSESARGAADRFERLSAESLLAPDHFRIDVYRKAMSEILPRVRLVVLPPGTDRLDVELVEGRPVLPPSADSP